MKYQLFGIALISTLLLSFKSTLDEGKWSTLFNGHNLTGWNVYIRPDADSSGKIRADVISGLNHDPAHVFTIVKQAGENVIRVSGEKWGGISTTNEFENYHLQLQFKWGDLTWGEKKGKKKDSGLLYHSGGKYGADAGAWMRSQEFQIEEGNTGDYWGVAGGTAEIPVNNVNNQYIYAAGGQLTPFSETSKAGRHCIKGADGEKASGEWNTLDLYCHGDTSVHMVNGKTVMVLYHLKNTESGQATPLSKGKIQLQSEGAEVFYKNIKIQPIDKLPALIL